MSAGGMPDGTMIPGYSVVCGFCHRSRPRGGFTAARLMPPKWDANGLFGLRLAATVPCKGEAHVVQ